MSYELGRGGVWFICDRCGGQWRRRHASKEWTGEIVCPECLDPKPAELTPPVVYPEGVPIPDARPPQGYWASPPTQFVTSAVTRDELGPFPPTPLGGYP